MKVLRQSRRLVGCPALALALAGAAAATATPAQAGGAVIPVLSHVVASWGDNGRGQLGNGSTALISGPVQVANLNNATQVAAGVSASRFTPCSGSRDRRPSQH
jgi:hypothetical protein